MKVKDAIAIIKEAAIEVRQDGDDKVYILDDAYNSCAPNCDYCFIAPAIMISADEKSISAYGHYEWDFDSWFDAQKEEYGDDFMVDDGGDWPWHQSGEFKAHTETMFNDNDADDVASILHEARV